MKKIKKRYEVEIEQTNYGYVVIYANSPEEARNIVNKNQIQPDQSFIGSAIKARTVEESI